MQITAYDANNQAIASSTATQYHSNTGDWRTVTSDGGYEVATLYRRGLGVYLSSSRTGVTVRTSNHAPGCPLRTAEQLRNLPKFSRTEEVLGIQTYVLSQRLPAGYVMETYFAPKLGGGTPFKRIYKYDDGRKVVEEPISVILGEPSPADIRGPEYSIVEQLPVYNKELAKQILTQPEPMFPPGADAAGFGNTVCVSVIIDESGVVRYARANTPITFLREPAVEAAYQATFSPTYCNGRPVLSSGIVAYKHTPAQLAKK